MKASVHIPPVDLFMGPDAPQEGAAIEWRCEKILVARWTSNFGGSYL